VPRQYGGKGTVE